MDDVPPKAKPKHLLWLLFWWKSYTLQGHCCNFLGGIDKVTFIKWRDLMEAAVSNLPVVSFVVLQDLTSNLIDWNDRFEYFKPGNRAAVTADCTDFQVWETYPFEPDLFSYKFNGPGLRYEIGVCIQTGLIVWINGPYLPRSWTDLNIFRHRMIRALWIGEWVVGDQGFRDGFQFVIPKRSGPQWLQEMTALATARHETINSRLKKISILRTAYRHGKGLEQRLLRHEQSTKAIANVVNIWLII